RWTTGPLSTEAKCVRLAGPDVLVTRRPVFAPTLSILVFHCIPWPGRAAPGSLFAHPWRDVAALHIADACRVLGGICRNPRSFAIGRGAVLLLLSVCHAERIDVCSSG